MAQLDETITTGDLGHETDHEVLARKANYVFDVMDYGAVGDGSTDDAAAIQAAIDAASAVGGGITVLIPPGDYASTVIQPKSNIRISGYGAAIRNIGTGTHDELIEIAAQSNIIIEGLTLDGDKAAFGATTEHRHGIYAYDSEDLSFRDVNAHDHKGDGLHLATSYSAPADGCVRVRAYNCDFYDNHRQGVSITSGEDMKFFGCRFRGTSGAQPASGADLEPNGNSEKIGDIGFYGCDFYDNDGYGLVVSYLSTSTTTPKGPTLVGCSVYDNRGFAGIGLSNFNGGQIIGCDVYDNTANGYYIVNGGSDLVINGGLVKGNGSAGIAFQYAGGLAISNTAINGLVIVDNGATADYRAGIVLAGSSGTIDGVVISGCRIGNTSGATSQLYGVFAAPLGVTNVKIIGNDLRTNTTEADRLLGDLSTFSIIGNTGAAHTAEVTGARDDDTALADLLTNLESIGIITDSTTAS